MAACIDIRIQTQDFDLGAEAERVRRLSPETGALVTFTGLVRGRGEQDAINGLFLEHYPGMTEKSIGAIVQEAAERWNLFGATVVHRVGELPPGAQIVLVVTSSPHREAAFAAAEFIMDYLKTRAPFWKKERSATGGDWLGTRERDFNAAERW